MILVFDVGNTETTLGLFEADALRAHWRLSTDVPRTSDEYGVLLQALLRGAAYEPSVVTGSAIASVVRPATTPLVEACRKYFGVTAIVVDGRSRLPVVLDVDEPRTVGADRIVNTLAASRIYDRDAIVVDLGTATTYDCITAEGVFLGGVIQPGVRTMADSLFRRTSKLPLTEILPPKRVIGRNTEECIRAGVVLGAADSIDGLVRRIRKDWPTSSIPLVVATGGLAETLRPYCTEFEVVEPFLTLHGLRIAHELLSSGSGEATASQGTPRSARPRPR